VEDDPAPEVADWSREGPPGAGRHGDVYFSADDGLAEARAVFLNGCGLPEAWSGRTDFVVGELGFGAGLNIVALLDLWAKTSPTGARLHIFTVENDLVAAAEAARALAAWPEVAQIAGDLTRRWPGRARGFRRIDLPDLRATIDLAQMEAAAALAAWSGVADAWFLDGFSPALDPDIWRPEVLSLVAARSAPGARAATYTIAGAVRRGLEAAGFAVTRQPGHGRKRERLEGRMPARVVAAQSAVAPRIAPRIAVVGAGVAGASLVRALAAQGVTASLFEADRVGAGASGVPSALAAPRLDAGLGPIAELFAQAAARAADLYTEVPAAVIARGVVQLAAGERDAGRFAAIAASDVFEPGWLAPLTATEAATAAGEPVPAALALCGAVVVDPQAILRAWTGGTSAAALARVAAIEADAAGWRLLGVDGATLAEVDQLCLAAGAQLPALAKASGLADLPLTSVRGQVTLALGVASPSVSFGGYVAPAPGGALAGSTHDRGDTDARPREADDVRNLAAIAAVLPSLARRMACAPLSSWVGVRAASPDYLPVAGAAGAGVYLFGGLGSRGFCLAPLLGEHVAAQMLGRPSPLPAALAALTAPGRFAARAARRRAGQG
jgi:tRNA 5-methylaminomethyl-2-thiouridine biosynthesis bifunctional protein